MKYDAAIIGGGPAGLNAALVLLRACRSVILFDEGHPRNARSRNLHGFLSRDGIPPMELLQIGREECQRYGVEYIHGQVNHVERSKDFVIQTKDGRQFAARKLLLATGVVDHLPAIDGIRDFYGRGVYHCPYCDAWEYREHSLVAWGKCNAAVGLGLALRTWSSDITVCIQDGIISKSARDEMEGNGIKCRSERIEKLEGDSHLRQVTFDSGPPLKCDAFFFNTGRGQRSPLAELLGVVINDREEGETDQRQETAVKGVFLAGDAGGGVQFAVIAAAEGATSAVALNRELQDEDCAARKAWRLF